jgi:hypothetical protein
MATIDLFFLSETLRMRQLFTVTKKIQQNTPTDARDAIVIRGGLYAKKFH